MRIRSPVEAIAFPLFQRIRGIGKRRAPGRFRSAMLRRGILTRWRHFCGAPVIVLTAIMAKSPNPPFRPSLRALNCLPPFDCDPFMPADRPSGDAPKIFISYARKDIAFADRLAAALKARGFDPLIDRSEIYVFEDWWKRIENLIVSADTIVFVLSPDAVASDICAKEVSFAASLNKRFAPVVCRRVDDKMVPPALSKLNFAFLDDEARFEQNLDRLAEALTTDIEWVRKHTEFGEQARRWAEAGRPGPRGLLLRSPMLEEAERWIASRPHDAPEPTDDTRNFIAESRKAATRRRNILSGSLAAGLVAALGLAGLAYWMLRVSENQRNDALVAQSRFLARDSRQATDGGNAVLGALLALEALPKNLRDPERPFLNEAAYALEHAYANRRERLILPGIGQFPSASYSPDGALILLSGNEHIRILDANTGQQKFRIDEKNQFDLVRLLPGSVRLATRTYGDPTATTLWNVETGDKVVSWPHHISDDDPLFSPDGKRALESKDDGIRRLWDTLTGKEIATLGEAADDNDSIGRTLANCAFSPDGRRVVTSSKGGGLRLWNADTGAELVKLSLRDGYAPVFSPDDKRLLTYWRDFRGGEAESTIHVFDPGTGAETAVLKSKDYAFKQVMFSPEGANIISITRQDTDDRESVIQFWNVETGEQISVMRVPRSGTWGVSRIVVSADSSRIAGLADDGTLRLWDTATGAQLTALHVGNDEYPQFAFSPDGSRLLAAFLSGTRLIDAKTGRELPAPQGRISDFKTAFTADNRLFVTISKDGTAQVWDLKTVAPVFVLKGHEQEVLAAAFSSDGSRLVTTSVDGSARIWTIEPAAVIQAFRGHAGAIRTAVVSPDGKRLLSASDDKTARIWNLDSGDALLTLQGHDGTVLHAAFSRNGRRILTASADKTARVWDADTGREILAFRGHEDRVNSAEFSPDGKRIVTASSDKTARVWDAEDGHELFSIKHSEAVVSASFSPDGTQILTSELGGGQGGVAGRLWSADDGRPLKELKLFIDNPRFEPWWNALMKRMQHVSLAGGNMFGVTTSTAAFSPNGARIVTSPFRSLVQLWESDTGFISGEHLVDFVFYSALFSPDGARIVVAADDGTARTFTPMDHVEGGEAVASFGVRPGAMYAAAYTPDGMHVVTGSEDKVARLWSVPRCQMLIDAARNELPRKLSDNERLQYFLDERAPDREAQYYSIIRRTFAILLPKAGDVCR